MAIICVATAWFAAPVFADQDSAQAAINALQNRLKTCYGAVEQAEAAGANVNSLMVNLNDAAGLLSKAQLAYASNDYNSAYTYASQSQKSLDNFVSQASALKANANQENAAVYLTTVLSTSTSVALLCVGIGAWLILNRQGRKS